MATATHREENVTTFVEDATGRSYVKDTAVLGERYPPRAVLKISRDAIPAGVHDLIDHYDAQIVDVEAEAHGLTLVVTVPEAWKDAGNRTVREHGNSLVLTLSREALDASGIGLEKVDLHARHGEVHITKHDGGPRFPR